MEAVTVVGIVNSIEEDVISLLLLRHIAVRASVEHSQQAFLVQQLSWWPVWLHHVVHLPLSSFCFPCERSFPQQDFHLVLPTLASIVTFLSALEKEQREAGINFVIDQPCAVLPRVLVPSFPSEWTNGAIPHLTQLVPIRNSLRLITTTTPCLQDCFPQLFYCVPSVYNQGSLHIITCSP